MNLFYLANINIIILISIAIILMGNAALRYNIDGVLR